MATPAFATPTEHEREVFAAIVAHGRPLWEALPVDSALRHICEQGTRAMHDYLYGGAPAPPLDGAAPD